MPMPMQKRPTPEYCECHQQRRSDCRRGDDCKALAVKLHASPRPVHAVARWSIAGGLAFAVALVAGAFSGCAAPRLVCHDVVAVEVCESRTCRSLNTGRFIDCPPAPSAPLEPWPNVRAHADPAAAPR